MPLVRIIIYLHTKSASYSSIARWWKFQQIYHHYADKEVKRKENWRSSWTIDKELIKRSHRPQYQWPHGARHGTTRLTKQIGQTSSAGGFSINSLLLSPPSSDLVGGAILDGAVASPPPITGLAFRFPNKKRVGGFMVCDQKNAICLDRAWRINAGFSGMLRHCLWIVIRELIILFISRGGLSKNLWTSKHGAITQEN